VCQFVLQKIKGQNHQTSKSSRKRLGKLKYQFICVGQLVGARAQTALPSAHHSTRKERVQSLTNKRMAAYMLTHTLLLKPAIN